MREDTTIPFRNPALRDELSELARSESSARRWKRNRCVLSLFRVAARAASSSGFLLGKPDPQGVVEKVPLGRRES